MKYYSTKTYGHELGLSVCFRQHRAESHCRFLHGYALSFKFTFGAEALDKNGWVVDFGGLKELKQSLFSHYDHKLLIAWDDAELNKLLVGVGSRDGVVMDIRFVGAVGCEAFAQEGYNLAASIVHKAFPHARVISCEVSEHGGNSAIYKPEEV